MGFSLSAGEKVTIKSSGQWTGGQRDRAAPGSNSLTKTLYTDANGGNGLAIDVNGNVVNGQSFGVYMNPNLCGNEPCGYIGIRSGTYCDATLEKTIPGILPAQRCSGASPLPALFVTIPGTVDPANTPSLNLSPDNNRGPICSDKNRIVSVLYGVGHTFVKANECLQLDKSRLIGKLVPKGAELTSIAPIDIGKKYELLPFEIPPSTPSGTDICFRNNDTDMGIEDNEGFLQVTVEKVP